MANPFGLPVQDKPLGQGNSTWITDLVTSVRTLNQQAQGPLVRDRGGERWHIKASNAVGDGVTPDQAALLDGLTQAGAYHVPLFVDGSVYALAAPTAIPGDNLVIEGAGLGSVLKATAAMGALLTFGTRKSVTVRDLTLDGSGLADNLATFDNVSDVTFERVTFKGAKVDGIAALNTGAKRVKFIECSFPDLADSAHANVFARAGFYFIRCQFSRDPASLCEGPLLYAYGVNIRVIDCEFDGGNVCGQLIYSRMDRVGRQRIRGNTFMHSSKKTPATQDSAGVFYDAINMVSDGAAPNMLEVLYNEFIDVGLDANGANVGGCIVVNNANTARRIYQLNASFNSMTDCGQAVLCGEFVENFVCAGNSVLRTAKASGLAGRFPQAIECHALRFSILGNVMSDNGWCSIWCGSYDGSPRSGVVSSNVIKTSVASTTTSPTGQVQGIYLAHAADVTCEGNVIEGDGTINTVGYGLLASTSDSARLSLRGGQVRNCGIGVSADFFGAWRVRDLSIQGVRFSGNLMNLHPQLTKTAAPSCQISGCPGLVSKSKGVATIPSGSTTTDVSHGLEVGPTALTLQYLGAGTAATVFQDGAGLTTTITGGPGGENQSLVYGTTYDTVQKLADALNAVPGGIYQAVVGAGWGSWKTAWLAYLAGQPIKAAPANLALVGLEYSRIAVTAFPGADSTNVAGNMWADRVTSQRIRFSSHADPGASGLPINYVAEWI